MLSEVFASPMTFLIKKNSITYNISSSVSNILVNKDFPNITTRKRTPTHQIWHLLTSGNFPTYASEACLANICRYLSNDWRAAWIDPKQGCAGYTGKIPSLGNKFRSWLGMNNSLGMHLLHPQTCGILRNLHNLR